MNCEWISTPYDLEIQGCKIKRGFFYLGEALPVYKKKRLCENPGRKQNIHYIQEPVISSNLEISTVTSRRKTFTSYATMCPYQRFQYLRWLSGETDVNETPQSYICYYLWIISIRLFCDDDCNVVEADSISKYLDSILEERLIKCKNRRDPIIYNIDLIQSYICMKFQPERLEEYTRFAHVRLKMIIDKIELSSPIDATKAYDICSEFFHVGKSVSLSDYNTIKTWWEGSYSHYNSVLKQHPSYTQNVQFPLNALGGNTPFSPPKVHLNTLIIKHPRAAIECLSKLHYVNGIFMATYRSIKAIEAAKKIKAKIAPKEVSIPKPSSPNNAIISTFADSAVNTTPEGVRYLQSQLQSEMQFLSIGKLMEALDCEKYNQLIKTHKLKAIYQGMLAEGLGMAPTPTCMSNGFHMDDEVVIFRRGVNDKYEPDYLFDFIDVFLKLAAYISQGITTEREHAFIWDFIKSKDKREGNQKQLYACFLWYIRNIRNINAEIKQSVNNDLNSKGRESVAKHLIEYVESDLDTMFTKEHLLPNVLPILTTKHFSISDAKRNEAMATIDLNKLGKIKQDTQVAQSFLSDIFIEDEEPVVTEKSNDFEYADILAEILSKDSWNRTELSNLSKKRGLILGSLLEKINDYSYSKVDDAIIEDNGDMLYVNVEYKKELL